MVTHNLDIVAETDRVVRLVAGPGRTQETIPLNARTLRRSDGRLHCWHAARSI